MSEYVYTKKDRFFLFLSIILGVLFDVLFYNKAVGISVSIFLLAFIGGFVFLCSGLVKMSSVSGWFLIASALLIALTFGLFSNRVFMELNFVIIILLLFPGMFIIACWHRIQLTIAETATSIALILAKCLFIGFANIIKVTRSIFDMSVKIPDFKNSPQYKVVLGILCSLPIIIVLTLLLTSADQVMAKLIDAMFSNIFQILLIDFLPHYLIVVLIAAICFGSIWAIVKFNKRTLLYNDVYDENEQTETIKKESGSIMTKFKIDPITISTILVMINLLYIVFTLIQFKYLFNGGLSMPYEGYAYSEYAVKGFWELIAVTAINLSIVLFSLLGVKRESIKAFIFVKTFLTLIILHSFIMLYSSHFRLSLYEGQYGYTFLRIISHSFTLFLSLILVIAIYDVWRNGYLRVKKLIAASIIWYIAFNYANPDKIIARKNIERFYKTGKIDLNYMKTLSCEIIPLITELEKELNVKKKQIAPGVTDSDVNGMLYSIDEMETNTLSSLRKYRDSRDYIQSYNKAKEEAYRILTQKRGVNDNL